MQDITPTPQATLLTKIHHAIDNSNDADIDSLTKQLAELKCDPEAITEDGFDVADAVGKVLALIKQGIPIHEILAWVGTHWASLFKCLECFLSLCLAVNHFTLLADESDEVLKLRNKSCGDLKLDQADCKKI
ncbi:hypothetical protein BDR03DRAFT_1011442 [Suillus americanus]|nr:hypothetical protein BDR03DRAFT_1011442 [Suillus americanus]